MDGKQAMEQLAAVVRDIDRTRAMIAPLRERIGASQEEAPLLAAARAVLTTHAPAPASAGVAAELAQAARDVVASIDDYEAVITDSHKHTDGAIERSFLEMLEYRDVLAARLAAG